MKWTEERDNAILVWIILGSIYQGIATPTEAAALGAIASLILSAVVYRELTWEKLPQILKEAARSSVMVLMIIAAAMALPADGVVRAGQLPYAASACRLRPVPEIAPIPGGCSRCTRSNHSNVTPG